MFEYLATNPLTFVLFVAWSVTWKGLALWRAAKNDNAPWFVALLVINTAGILEILYLYLFSKTADSKTA